jgi:hypothetical protein
MELKELSLLFQCSIQDGAGKALAESKVLPKTITKSQAYRLYGRSDVDRWLAEGLITSDSICKKINRTKLERVAASSNRTTYLPVAER